MSPFLIWSSLALFFLLAEALTVTLYGLVIAIGCAVAGLMAYFMGGFHWTQILTCLVVVTVGSILVPRIFHRAGRNIRTGLDAYTGTRAPVKMIDHTAKISLDGVDRLIRSKDTLVAGDTVEIIGRDGTILEVVKR